MKDIQLVILMAGKSTRLQPLNYNMPKGLNSFMQIPAIYTMIIDYINRGLDDITIIASPQNKDIIEGFLSKAFSNIKTKVVVQDNPKGPLDAFRRVKKVKKSTLLLLGDTTCETTNDFNHSFGVTKSQTSTSFHLSFIDRVNTATHYFRDIRGRVKPKNKACLYNVF